MENITAILSRLFQQWSGVAAKSIIPLPRSGSERHYWRLGNGKYTAIGAWNPTIEENEAFFSFTLHFHQSGLNVPAIYGIDKDRQIYLVEDLGDLSLFSLLADNGATGPVSPQVTDLYRKTLSELIRFQVIAGKGVDFSKSYPHAAFDQRSMRWDLNYFKYYFLKLHVPFHEGRLEDDFDKLVDFLGKAESDYFMYRDFQSRNIFIKDNKPYFIDYQGGRKGPLQYDLASLLFQVRADLPFELRAELLNYYIAELKKFTDIDEKQFRDHFNGFVLIRLLQVLGAYGFRGLLEKKRHFLVSIPYALKNLAWWHENMKLPLDLPELYNCFTQLAAINKYDGLLLPGTGPLSVTIKSFSYREGIPDDLSGNGGGFVFDCRALPNPGREERYRAYNGKDQVIIDYLKDEPAVIRFLDEAEKIISLSVENYLERGFNSLSVAFGCTGGQHRSVYCTETMAKKLKAKYPGVEFKIEHLKF